MGIGIKCENMHPQKQWVRLEFLKALCLEDLCVPSLHYHVLSQSTGLELISSLGEEFP